MKRLGLLILSVLLLLSLVACDKNDELKTEAPTDSKTEEVEADSEAAVESNQPENQEETEEESSALESTEEDENTVQVERVYDQASDLVSALIQGFTEHDLDRVKSTLSPDLQAQFASIKKIEARATVQEILWEKAFIEFYIDSLDAEGDLPFKAEDYLSFLLEKEDGRWLVTKVQPTAELFHSDSKLLLKPESKQSNVKKWHFENLSSFPLTFQEYQNAGEFIVNKYENKRIFLMDRWQDNHQTKLFFKLIEFNGELIPAELVYKKDGEVYTQQEQSADFGLFLHSENTAGELLDRLEKLFDN